MPGDGGSPVAPDRRGDDDQPTDDGEGGLRATAVSPPYPGAGGLADQEITGLRIVKKLVMRSERFVKMLIGFIP